MNSNKVIARMAGWLYLLRSGANIKIVTVLMALGIQMAFGGMPARAEAVMASGNPNSPTLEIESQIPCLINGGYHLAAGMRFDRFRFRAQIINSGSFDFEPFGLDDKSDAFERFYDNKSYSVLADYFLNDHWHVYGLLGSHRWLLQDKTSGATEHLRTVDAGLGLGFQYFLYKDIYIQPAAAVLFRERKSISVGNENYRIPGMELSPALRLGIRL